MSDKPYVGWPQDARELIESAVARHGGWELWRRLRSVHCEVQTLGGPLPFLKGLHRTHPMAPRFQVLPHERRADLEDYPQAGQVGIFEDGVVRLAAAGAHLCEDRDRRASFAGLRKLRRWDPLDALYFFGYALVTYMSVPFFLPQTSFVAPAAAPGLRGVTVDFPPGFHSHCQRQTFFFDETDLLRRHDYTAEIVGNWARGAHFSDDYVDAGGLQVATRRHVMALLLGRPTPLPVLHARFRAPSITTAP